MPADPPDDSQATSLSLLARARGRDPAAWERLVREYSPLVYFWVRRSGLADADAADVVQETWAAVSRGLAGFTRDAGAGTFRGWLWTVARNKLRDHARRRAGTAEAAGGARAHAALGQVPDPEPADDTGVETSGLLHRALDLVRADFEPHTWQAFWQLAVGGRPAADVAANLGMAANAVRQAKFRVLRRLRQELEGLGLAGAAAGFA